MIRRKRDLTEHVDILNKAKSRVAKLPVEERLDWADTCITILGKSLDAYRKDRDEADWLEATHALAQVRAVLESLQ